MILKRKIYEKLLNWKADSKGKKALMIEGARRIGKSTIAEEFAKNEYKSYILIDFSKTTTKIKKYFRDYMEDLDTFFMLLSASFGVTLYPRETLIIFDEVQKYPRARECIKFLVKDGRFDYLETGSLISIRENVKDIVIPSEEQSVKMYPLDFEEFCQALNSSEIINYIKLCYEKKKPLENDMHKQAMMLFKQYMLVGGMPQSVIAFIENNKNFERADSEKRDILKLYRSDIMKIKSAYKAKVLTLYDQLPGLLSKHEKRVVLKNIVGGSSTEQYEKTFFWLQDSMICNMCFNCNDPNVGLAINEDRTYVKCYFGDTGLLVSHAFNENELSNGKLYNDILNDNLSINEGMLYENVISQMLTANGYDLYFYTKYSEEKHRNDIEIDFIISNGSKINLKIYPIEVKSSKNYSTTSLTKFNDKFKERIGESYVVHTKNFSVDNGVIYLPSYMVFCLK